MSLVPCEPTGSSFSTPGSLPISFPIPGPTQSHSIPVSTDRPSRAMLPSHDFSHLPQPASSEMWLVVRSGYSSCAPAMQADRILLIPSAIYRRFSALQRRYPGSPCAVTK